MTFPFLPLTSIYITRLPTLVIFNRLTFHAMTDLGNFAVSEEISFLTAPSTDEYTLKTEFNNRVLLLSLGSVNSGDPITAQASLFNEDYVYCAQILDSESNQVGDDYRFKVSALAVH